MSKCYTKPKYKIGDIVVIQTFDNGEDTVESYIQAKIISSEGDLFHDREEGKDEIYWTYTLDSESYLDWVDEDDIIDKLN